jgi:hypothetical protein
VNVSCESDAWTDSDTEAGCYCIGRSRGGSVITIGRCHFHSAGSGARGEGQANHPTKLRCRNRCGCWGWMLQMRAVNVSWTLQNLPMRYASMGRTKSRSQSKSAPMPSVQASVQKRSTHTLNSSGLCFLPSPTSQSQTQQNAFRRLHYSHS